MSAWGEGSLQSSCHGYLPGGLNMFLAKKKDLKITYGFKGSISNIDLGLFQPNNVQFCGNLVLLNHLNNVTVN